MRILVSSILVFLVYSVFFSELSFGWSIKKSTGKFEIKGPKGKTAADLVVGQSVITGLDGKVLLMDGESEVWIGPSSNFQIYRYADPEASVVGRLDLIAGKLRAKFKRPSGPEAFPYEVKTRSVVAGVRGTEFFIEVDSLDEKVCTLEGLVRVSSLRSAAESWDVAAGHGLFIKPREMPKVRETPLEQQKKWIEATTF